MLKIMKHKILPIIIIILITIICDIPLIIDYVKNQVQDRINIKVNDKNIDLKFERKIDNLLVYKDKEENKYLIKNNKIVGYNKNITNLGLNDKKGEFDLNIDLVENNKNIFGYNLENYVLEKENNEYLYLKYINNIKTSDGIYIKLNKDGVITHFKINKIDFFDDLITNVTKAQIYNYIDQQMKKYDILNYRVRDMIIDYQDSNYIVDCFVDGKNIESMEIIYQL